MYLTVYTLRLLILIFISSHIRAMPVSNQNEIKCKGAVSKLISSNAIICRFLLTNTEILAIQSFKCHSNLYLGAWQIMNHGDNHVDYQNLTNFDFYRVSVNKIFIKIMALIAVLLNAVISLMFIFE